VPRAKAPKPVVDQSKRWLDSYADVVTLLMAFFVMLFAFALVDETKYEAFRRGIADTFAQTNPVTEGGTSLLEQGDGVAELVTVPPQVTDGGNPTDGPGSTTEPGRTEGEELLADVSEVVTEEQAEALRETIEARLQELNAQDYVSVARDGRGVVITFDEAVLFPSGKATINVDGQIVLGAVAQVLRPFSNQILVEGHTDSVPTNGGTFPTNWELGSTRSVNVTRYFAEIGGIPGAQLQSISYGEFRPRDTNQTAEGRAANRRVEVVVLVDGLAAPTPDLTTGLFEGIGAPLSEHSTAPPGRREATPAANADTAQFPRPGTTTDDADRTGPDD
jgi:chemotaxis protein MotB